MNKQKFLEDLKQKPIVIDGAMGTELYALGVGLDKCFDEQNISNAELVKDVYQTYINSGADVIKTNTFGANAVKLSKFGLSHLSAQINEAGVKLAKEIIAPEQYLAGSMGPCLNPNSVWKSEETSIIKDAFANQAHTLITSGVDMIILETFSHISELTLAIDCIKEESEKLQKDIILIAGFTVGEDGVTAVGDSLNAFISRLESNTSVDAILINCGMGPSGLYELLEKHIQKIQKPLFVSPNAGSPRELDNRTVYLSTPEYFARFARRFVKLGVCGVGGCCGTTGEHIKASVKELKNLEHYEYISVKNYENITIEDKAEPCPLQDKSPLAKKFYDKTQNPSLPNINSIELVPPKGTNLNDILEKSRICKEGGVDAINLPDGPRASARLSPFVTAMEIQRQIGIETILHYP